MPPGALILSVGLVIFSRGIWSLIRFMESDQVKLGDLRRIQFDVLSGYFFIVVGGFIPFR